MKRLYGTTNKRNAEHQIAKRVRRLERANLTLDTKQRFQDHTAKPKPQPKATKQGETKPRRKAMKQGETSAEGDPDLRYYISASKNRPQEIFSTIRNNQGDPAYYVCFTGLHTR